MRGNVVARRKKLPKPQTVRFQTSQRGVNYPTLAAARADFLAWLDEGESPAGAEIKVHIWQNDKERILDEIGNDPRGERLREVLRSALRSGKLQIRKVRKNRA
jgi:hypothetical protein